MGKSYHQCFKCGWRGDEFELGSTHPEDEDHEDSESCCPKCGEVEDLSIGEDFPFEDDDDDDE